MEHRAECLATAAAPAASLQQQCRLLLGVCCLHLHSRASGHHEAGAGRPQEEAESGAALARGPRQVHPGQGAVLASPLAHLVLQSIRGMCCHQSKPP